MSDLTSPSLAIECKSFDAARVSEVQSWLASQFDAAGRVVPKFQYTPRSIAYLHTLATASQASTRSAQIIASDLRLKASDYRSQAVRIREILENVGLAQESLSSAQVLVDVANLLNIKDTEMSSFLVAMGAVFLRKTGIEEERDKVKKESEILLDYTRKAIAKLTFLKKALQKLDDEVPTCEVQMVQWKKNFSLMVLKERQYMQQLSNYKALLNHVGYMPHISHSVLVEMAEHKKELEKKLKPILVTLRSYQDLPSDKALAVLATENKRRQFAAAEKYLEEVLHAALTTAEYHVPKNFLTKFPRQEAYQQEVTIVYNWQ